jgi:hypothetical protein
MRPLVLPAVLAAACLVPIPAAARQAAGHDHGELGAVHFPVSCSPAAAEEARRGLALLHHMTYEPAEQAFAAAVTADPACVMGYWGRAMSFIHPLWSDPPTAEKFARAEGYLAEAERRGARTDWERDYLAAVGAYYAAGRGEREMPNLRAFAAAWEDVHRRRATDDEAAAFHALTLVSVSDPADKTQAVRRRAGAVAESVLIRTPSHPGGHHYAIHAYDVPALAADADRVARSYGALAPDVPHALHMPSHIFTRVGDWDAVVDYNRRSAEAALARPVGDSLSMHYLHALDYMAYAYLQQGKDREAREVAATLAAINQPIQAELAAPYALAAVPARLALERQDWKAAAALPIRDPASFPWDRFPAMEALTWHARGLGAARSGNMAGAQAALARLAELRAASAVSSPYWAKQVEIQRLEVEAWTEYAAGRKDAALATMQQAAELEATTDKHPVTPGELLPADELLGDMLLALGRKAEARAAYQSALARSPGRRNALRGVERAGG